MIGKRRNVGFVLLIGFFCLSLLGPQSSFAGERKKIVLRVAAAHPYASSAWVKSLKDNFVPELKRRVLAETNKYEIVCKEFYGGTIAKPAEVLEAVENGIADIGIICSVFELSKLVPHNFTYWLPMTSSDQTKLLHAYQKMKKKLPVFQDVFMKNYNQRQLGDGLLMMSSFQLITAFPVTKLEDLKGKKLGHGGTLLPWLEALGATPVQSNFTEVYTSLELGVYDGYSMPANSIMTYKIYEVAPYYTVVDFGAEINGYLTINMKTWNKLPKEVQKIMDEVGTGYSEDLIKRNEAEEAQALGIMKKHGNKVSTLSGQERSRWAKVLYESGLPANSASLAEKGGYPGGYILKSYIQALEEEGYKLPHSLQ